MVKLFPKAKKILTLLILGAILISIFLPLQLAQASPDPGFEEWCPEGATAFAGCGTAPWEWLNCAKGIGETLACTINFLLQWPIRIVFLVTAGIMGIVVLILALLGSVVLGILNWMIEIALSVRIIPEPGITNIVTVGWTFTHDLVNILLILVLVIIGLATILRLETWQAKKTLPKLLLVALLINFSLVLVGFVVDVGNLFTNFFFEGAAGLGGLKCDLTQPLEEQPFCFIAQGQAYYMEITNMAFQMDLGIAELIDAFIGLILKAVALQLFYTFAAIVFFFTAIVFFLRIIFLWILAILAPIAFLSLALPPTRTVKMLFPDVLHWDEWWTKLIQWTIIGVPLGFFIFLAAWISAPGNIPVTLTTGFESALVGQGLTAALASLIYSFLSPAVALVILFLGVTIAIKAAPSAAQGILEFGKKAGTRAMKWEGLAAGTALGRRISPQVETWGKRLAERGERPGEEKGIFAKRWGKTIRFGERWAGRGIGLGAGALYRQIKTRDENEINAGKKEATDKDSADNFRKINEELVKGRLANWNRVAGLFVGTRENGDGDDIEKAFKEGGALAVHAPKLKKIIEAGQRAGPPGYRPIVKALFGHIITNPKAFGYNADYNENTGTFTGNEDDIETLEGFKGKTPEKMTAQDFQGNAIAPENFNPDTPAGRFFIQTMIRERGADFMPQFARRPKRSEREKLMQYIFKKGKFANTGLGKSWLLENHAEDVLRYMDSPGARSAGIGIPETRAEIEDTIAERMSGKEDTELKKEEGELKARLDKARSEKRGEKVLRKIRDQIARIDRELKFRLRTADEFNQEIKDKVKRKLEINAIAEENMTADLYRELAEIEEILRRDNTELKRRELPAVEVKLPILVPKPTKGEIREFRAIASAQKLIPEKGRLEDRLRNIRGAIRESFGLQEGVKKEMKEVEELMKEATARGEAVSVFKTKLGNLGSKLDELQKRERELKDKESQFEEEHLKRKK